jgi:heterodisulfide reductase subunit A
LGTNLQSKYHQLNNRQLNKGVIMGSTKSSKSGSVMVVGAGIAGMQAALDLANSDYNVYLVEKSPTIGGLMARLDKTFPTNDCTM